MKPKVLKIKYLLIATYAGGADGVLCCLMIEMEK